MAVEGGKAGPTSVSLKRAKEAGLDVHLSATVMPAGASAQILTAIEEFKGLIYVRYRDHVLYNRSFAEAMAPQIRETIGWLVYESEEYLTLKWDKDAEPPTLKGGDSKATGLVILRSDIIGFKRLEDFLPLKFGYDDILNSGDALLKKRVCVPADGAKNSSPNVQRRRKTID